MEEQKREDGRLKGKLNYIALGGDEGGRQVEIGADEEYIKWRYKGDREWINLIALESLQGKPGINGERGPQGVPGSTGMLYPTTDTSTSVLIAPHSLSAVFSSPTLPYAAFFILEMW